MKALVSCDALGDSTALREATIEIETHWHVKKRLPHAGSFSDCHAESRRSYYVWLCNNLTLRPSLIDRINSH